MAARAFPPLLSASRVCPLVLASLSLLFRDHSRGRVAVERRAERARARESEQELLHLHLAMHRRSVKAPAYRSITWQRGTDNVAPWSLTPTAGYRTLRESVGTDCASVLRNIIRAVGLVVVLSRETFSPRGKALPVFPVYVYTRERRRRRD